MSDHRLNKFGVFTWVLIAIAGLLAIVSPTDPDVFWQLKHGERMMTSAFVTADDYSFTAAGRSWIAHEWLFDLAGYMLMKSLGYRALVVAAGAMQALATWVFVRLVRARGASQALTLVLSAVFLIFVAPTWGVRAQLVTAPLAGAVCLVLLRYRKDTADARILWLLPLLMLAWVNLHASFPLGLVLIGFFLAGNLAERLVYRAPARSRPALPLTVALGASFIITLLNPVGVRLWTLFSRTPDIRVIEEWRSVDFHDPLNLVFAAAVLLLGIIGLGRPAPPHARRRFRLRLRSWFDFPDVLIVLFVTTMALRYGRLSSLYGMLVLPLLGQALAHAWPAVSRRAESLAKATDPPRHIDYLIAGLVTAGFAAFAIRSPMAQLGSAPSTDSRFAYPAGAAAYLDGARGARIFNEYAWGGYLLYRLYPHARVFIDGRADLLYPKTVFDDYEAIHGVAPTYREVLARSGSDFVLVPPDIPLATVLASDVGWRLVFADSVSVLYQRATGAASL